MSSIATLEYSEHVLKLIDQRKLPNCFNHFLCRNWEDCEYAIKEMVVRGAPAIAVTSAYGIVLAAHEYQKNKPEKFISLMHQAMNRLSASRPTAVNLVWAVNRMRNVFEKTDLSSTEDVYQVLKQEADSIFKEEVEKSKKISLIGAELIKDGYRILTHCNTGSLAVPGYGTALGMIKMAHESGKNISVYADETRPRLQGARLTAWELLAEGIPVTLITEGTAACLLRDGKVDIVVVGADRIAVNGDTANKIGTFLLALVASKYNIPFFVAAPSSTIDFSCASGKEITIEERSAEEITMIDGIRIAPEGIAVYNPAFDVTPSSFISAIITEQGVLRPPFIDAIKLLA